MELPTNVRFNKEDSEELLLTKLHELGLESQFVEDRYLRKEDRGNGYSEMIWLDEKWAEYFDKLVEEADLIQDELDSRKPDMTLTPREKLDFSRIDINMMQMKAEL